MIYYMYEKRAFNTRTDLRLQRELSPCMVGKIPTKGLMIYYDLYFLY
jgi:hypothetical protein